MIKEANTPPNEKPRGRNVLEEAKPKTPVQSFLEQLNDPLIFVLFVAAAISMLLGEFSDTAIILAVIMVNAIVGGDSGGQGSKGTGSAQTADKPHCPGHEERRTRGNSCKRPDCGGCSMPGCGTSGTC